MTHKTAFLIAIGFTAAVLLLSWLRQPHVNPCTANKGDCYSIQGEGGTPGCPGQHKTTVEIDNQSYFLECY